MGQIVFASSNEDKIKEVKHVLMHLPYDVVPQSNFNISSVDETGLSFVENAILKARHAAKISGLPCIADDSGLAVNALHGAPGIYSARYAGEQATSADNIAKLLEALKDVPPLERMASFHCVLVYMRNSMDPTPIICHGKWSGLIVDEPQGDHGFGYDPIFYVAERDRTAAQLMLDEKNKISHRAQALQQLVTSLAQVK